MIEGISKGKIIKPALVLLYGPDGCGKSTFGSEAPSPIFIGSEDGSAELDVHRFGAITSYKDVVKNLTTLSEKPHDYKTLVIDSLDWLEPLIWKEVCAQDPKKPDVIEDAFGGFGKGYTRANQIWKEMMGQLSALRDTKKMNIIIIAHSQIKVFNDPSKPLPYDRYLLKLNEKAAALWREFVDCVLFVNFEVHAVAAGKNDRKAKVYGEDKRLMYSQRRPSFDAKNRYGLPFELPLGWSYFDSARKAGTPDTLEQVVKDLGELTESPQLSNKKDAILLAMSKANNQVEALIKIRNHARTLIGEN